MRLIGMTHLFQRPVLLCNSQSGSHDPDMETQFREILAAASRPLVHTVHLPDGDVPSADDLRALDADLLIVWTGDGTIRAAAEQADGWDGAILPLPGGTLNLLSKSLHGDRDPISILRDVVSDHATRRSIPILQDEKGALALINLLAGPATRWAEVRETMRQEGIISATREAPEALEAMQSAPGVSVAGHDGEHSAVVLTPLADGIDVKAITAGGTMDLLRHGLAWLSGDFRDGPSEFIIKAPDITLESRAVMSVEYDGELMERPSPLRVRLIHSQLEFVSTT